MTTPQVPTRECDVFVRYLTGTAPTPYVQERYERAHTSLATLSPHTGFDRLLVRTARIAPWVARALDAYAAIFARRSALRAKLVTLLAICEVTPPFSTALDQADGSGVVPLMSQTAVRGAATALALIATTTVMLPIQLWARCFRR